jgi:predicted acyltransferase
MNRSLALDVFRGLTVVFMILVNNPGTWSHVYPPLLHAPWHGLTFTDLVFPFFLFAVGNAQAIVFPKMWELHPQGYFFRKVFKRTLIIFLIGFFLSWFPFFHWLGDELTLRTWTWMNTDGTESGIRIMGVLQRIALAYGFSAVIEYFFPRKALTIGLILLLLYWGICSFFGASDPYSLEGWVGTSLDRHLLGPLHLYQGEGVPFDPEGLLSTLPATAQVLLGFWAGRLMAIFNPRKSVKSLMKRGVILTILGVAWHFVHPINKKIWTGSYVLVTTGLSLVLLSLLIRYLDLKKLKPLGLSFFEAFGKNPLFIFVLSGLIPKALKLIRIESEGATLSPLSWFYETICALFPGPPENGSLFYALILVGFYGWLVMWLDRKRIYIKV